MVNQNSEKFLTPILIGSFSGCCSVLITNPLDLAKTRLQIQGELRNKGLYNKQLNGITDTLIKTLKNEGIKSLQKGLVPSLGYQIILNGIRLGMYEKVKKIGHKHVQKQYRSAINVVSGGFLGLVAGFAASPFNMIKTRIMMQSNFLENGNRYQYGGFLCAVKTIYTRDGAQGFFNGSRIWAMRTCLAAAVQLPFFDLSKTCIQDDFGIKGLPGYTLASASSSFLLCVIVCPIDGLSTRYQNQQFDHQGKGILYKSLTQGVKNILQTEGFFGFYKGFSALLARLGSQTFISLILFSHLTKLTQN